MLPSASHLLPTPPQLFLHRHVSISDYVHRLRDSLGAVERHVQTADAAFRYFLVPFRGINCLENEHRRQQRKAADDLHPADHLCAMDHC